MFKMCVGSKKQDSWLDSTSFGGHLSVTLTFADMQPFDPRVLDICVAATSTHLKPSATGSATTDSAGFHERATLGARH